uniref:Reduction in Cnn dots 5 n=1 Tax=Papilio xuthus TaxID=66420 RepID=I4DNR1_PAPXU|nr:reduction in Cnn dots 5 [Papilio xuthus]
MQKKQSMIQKLQDFKEDGMDVEMQLADRVEKKDIRLLENSLSRWQVLVQSVAGGNVELDKNTLAVLRGRLVRYLMRSREIAVGRSTRDHTIDVDLTLEGPAAKVSRKQATIRLRNSGDFIYVVRRQAADIRRRPPRTSRQQS